MVSVQQLANGDMHRPLRIEVWDYESDGKHDAMGMVETSLAEMVDCPQVSEGG